MTVDRLINVQIAESTAEDLLLYFKTRRVADVPYEYIESMYDAMKVLEYTLNQPAQMKYSNPKNNE